MTRRMTRLQRSTFDAEHLSVVDILLPVLGIMLVDDNLRTQTLQVRYTADMVPVPMCEKHLLHRGVLF